MASKPAAAEPAAPPPGRLARWVKKIWWLHSGFALAFGVGVMLFARAGLAYADKLLVALGVSWLLMFVALRFVVGPANRSDHEGLGRKGVRLATNYVIKQFYQQMFFFLVPLYASSATWSLSSWNWWLAPVLLACAVVSTMDLVFDNVVMERRLLASTMYGLAMFGLLNVLAPLVLGVTHAAGLVLAAAATPAAVALLSFSVRAVLAPRGALLTLLATGAMLAGTWYGRAGIPPVPLALREAAVGHGTRGSYECLPPSKHVLRAGQLDGLRCGAWLVEPGGIAEEVIHAWRHRGVELARVEPRRLGCDGEGDVFVSEFPPERLPADPAGEWACVIETRGGQLVGYRGFRVIGGGEPPAAAPAAPAPGPAPAPAAP
jgi:hypothetical protein